MEFVVCDDERGFKNNIKTVINKLYMTNDDSYRVHTFEKFNDEFGYLINDGVPKIYILDIEIKNSISGIDIARKIRSVDWQSVIIFITSHSELGYEALKARIMLLDFISKFDDFENHLEKTLKKAISFVGNSSTFKFNVDGISYIIHMNDILYISKDTVDRKSIIKTTYNEIEVNKSLSYFEDKLDDKFYMSHRSCYVNTSKIYKVDWKNNIIYFDTGDTTELLSRDKKKGLKEYVGC